MNRVLFTSSRPALLVACACCAFAFSPCPAQDSDLSIRIPDKSLKELADDERKEKETQVRIDRNLTENERTAVAAVEKKHESATKTLDNQINACNEKIKELRQRINETEEDVEALPGEIEELEIRAEELEREADRLWDFPDLVQADGTIYSNRTRSEVLLSEAQTLRTRADSRRTELDGKLRDIQRYREEIKKQQAALSAAIGKRESKEFQYRADIEKLRADIRTRALGSITTDDLVVNPGLLRQFTLGSDMETFILDFAEQAHDSEVSYPLDELLVAIQEELAEKEFVELLRANSSSSAKKNDSGSPSTKSK